VGLGRSRRDATAGFGSAPLPVGERTKIYSQGGKSPLFEMGHPEGWPVGGVRVTLSIGGMYYIAV